MDFFKDAWNFFKILSIVDIIFFVAIITLLILIVTLIYFIRINKDILKNNDDIFPKDDNDNSNSNEENEQIDENSILEEMSDDLSMEESKEEEYDDEEEAILDLESVTKKLKETEEERVNCTLYEKDQEEKAIISYDELLQKHNKYAINYEKEEIVDDVSVKKVDLNDLENHNKESIKNNLEVRVISYKKEEAFLLALKELNRLLN